MTEFDEEAMRKLLKGFCKFHLFISISSFLAYIIILYSIIYTIIIGIIFLIFNLGFSCNKGAIEGSRCFLMCEKGARLEVSLGPRLLVKANQ